MQRIRNIDEIITRTLLETDINSVFQEEEKKLKDKYNKDQKKLKDKYNKDQKKLKDKYNEDLKKLKDKYNEKWKKKRKKLKDEYDKVKDEYDKVQKDYCDNFLVSERMEKREPEYSRYDWWLLDTRKKNYLEKLQLEWGIYFCPYCGKNTIIHFWIEGEEFKRLYDIEHFLPRSKYSSLSINLYNRLPACMSCNQRLKWTKDPLESDDKIFHPYFWWICKSDIDHRLIDQDIDFDSKVSFIKKTNNHIEKREFIFDCWHWNFFELDKIYFSSEDTFQIFHFIYDKYTKIKDEYQRFKKNSKSIEAFIEYFFASYYPKEEQDILKYSNGKYKKDLIQYMRQLLESWEKDLHNK